jgi:membrane protein
VRYERPAWLDHYVPSLLMHTYASWRADRTIRMGASLAYYGLFSLSSVLAVALGLFRIIGRSTAVEQALVERLDDFLGSDSEVTATEIMNRLDGSTGTQLGLIGLGSLLVTGSLFFLAMEDAFNQIWQEPVRVGWRSTIRRRLVSLLVLLGAATALVVGFTLQAATSLLEAILPGSTGGNAAVAAMLTSSVGWGVLVAAVALLFRYLPPHKIAWRPAIVAALVTGIFLTIGSALIGWYLRTAGASSVVGVVSTPLAVLVWIYYEAQILLAGAQLTKHLAADHELAADGATYPAADAEDSGRGVS